MVSFLLFKLQITSLLVGILMFRGTTHKFKFITSPSTDLLHTHTHQYHILIPLTPSPLVVFKILIMLIYSNHLGNIYVVGLLLLLLVVVC